MFASAGFSSVSDPDNLLGSSPGGSLELFCLSKQIAFNCSILSQLSAFVAGLLVVSDLLEGLYRYLIVLCSLSIAYII